MGGLYHLEINSKNPLIIDIGGASTECVNSRNQMSIKLGVVSLTEEFSTTQILSKEQVQNIDLFIQNKLQSLKTLLLKNLEPFVFVGGTTFTLASIEKKSFDFLDIHGINLDLNTVDFYLKKISKLSLKERKKIPYLPSYRYDIFLSGLFILKNILFFSQKNTFFVSAGSVNHGLCMEYLN